MPCQPDFAKKLLSHLKLYHKGQENAIPSRALEARFCVHGATVRRAVLRLRRDGVPIGSGPSGYFYAITTPELQETVQLFHSRLTGVALVKQALAQTISQMPDSGQTILCEPKGGD